MDMGLPPPPGHKKREETEQSSEDDAKEIGFILRTTLKKEHLGDANVINWIMRYVECRSAKQAARDVGLPERFGETLKNRWDIAHAIGLITSKMAMKYGFEESEIVERFKEIAFIDPIEFERPDGTFKRLAEMSPEARRTIRKIKVKETFENDANGLPQWTGQILEIEFWDKMKAGELLGKGPKEVFKETKSVQHDVGKNMAALLLESAKRGEKRVRDIREVIALPSPDGEDEDVQS